MEDDCPKNTTATPADTTIVHGPTAHLGHVCNLHSLIHTPSSWDGGGDDCDDAADDEELRCLSCALSVWALIKLLKREAVGYLRSMFPSHWSVNRSRSDAPRWHRLVRRDKRRATSRAGGKCWRRDGEFPFDGRCVSASPNTTGSICPTPEVPTLDSSLSFWECNLVYMWCFSATERVGASAPWRTARTSTMNPMCFLIGSVCFKL